MKNNYLTKNKPSNFLRKFWLIVTLLMCTIEVKAQCPSGDVVLHTTYDVQQFSANYPNCTNLSGILQLGNLSNDYSTNTQYNVADPIVNNTIYFYLGNLQSVGGLKIYNTLLTNVHYFENLSNINGALEIIGNKYLTGLYGLRNVSPVGITNLILQSNNSLYSCSNEMICAYMNGSGPKTVSGNQSPCNNTQSLASACIPPCVAPTGVNSSNISAVGATIGWSSSGSKFDIEWGTQGFTLGTGTRQNEVSGQSYQITGLEGNTAYDVYVRQNCTVNQSSWVKHTFTTIAACPSSYNVYFYSQQDINNFGSNYPNCVNLNSNLNIEDYSSNINDLSPLGNLRKVNELRISYTKLTSLNGLNLENIYYKLDISSNYLLTDISALQNVNFNNFSQITIGANYLLSNCHINSICSLFTNPNLDKTIYGNSTTCQNYNSIYLACNPCSQTPLSLSSAEVISNQAKITWSGTQDLYDLEWGTQGFTQGTGSTQSGVNTLEYTITNLSPSTTYDVYVRKNCSSSQTDWVKHTFTTPAICPAGDIEYTTQQQVNDFGSIYPNCTQTSGKLKLGIFGTNNNINNLAPFSNLTIINGSLIIYNTASTNLNGLSSITTINGELDISNNNQLTDISGLQNINPTGITYLYLEQNSNLSNCNISNICNYIQIPENQKFILGNAVGCQDTAAIQTNCPCDLPTGVTISGNTSNSTKINWTGTSSVYDLEWGPIGFTQGTGTTQNNVTGSTYTITGLQPTTSYDVYIRRNCSAIQSDWVKKTFNTIEVCPSGQIGVSSQQEMDNFGTTYPNCVNLPGSISIAGNTITDISALSNLQSIGGYISIYYTSLTNLDALENITVIGTNPTQSNSGNVYISGNQLLTDVSKVNFSNINVLSINYNPNLSICNSPNICIYLQEGVGNSYLTGNASGCDSAAAIISNCDPYCTQPKSISASGIVSDRATINWVNSGTAHQMEWGPTGFIQGTGTAQNDIDGTSYTITGLEPSTSYDVYIRQICSSIELDSNWVKYTFSTITACPPPPVQAFANQQAIDDFGTNYPNCVNLQGILQLGYSALTNDIHDITPFSTLESITGHLSIYGTQLTNLDALSNLNTIKYRIVLTNNSVLTDISGLRNINQNTITDQVYFSYNPQLSVCNIENVCEFLQTPKSKVFHDNALGCENLSAVSASCACEALPTNISSVSSSSGATLNWTGETAKYDLEWGLEGFTQGSGTTQNNVNATSYIITGLSASTTYDVYVRSNCTNTFGDWVKHTITTLGSNCPSGNVELFDQQAVNIFGMMYPNCTHLPGSLYIGENTLGQTSNDIIDISGLSNIQNVNGSLYISGTQLENLNSLSSISSISGYLSIGYNTQLTDISGLQNITDWTISGFNISGNSQLTSCNISNICSKFSYQYAGSIVNNGIGCNDRDEIRALCGYIDCPTSSYIHLSSQEAVDGFGAIYPNCTQINGQLVIYGQDVTDISALSNIQTITGHFYINYTQLTNLDGLSSLTNIGERLDIYFNSVLTDISGLQNLSLDSVTTLNINQNSSLSDCNYAFLCEYLADTSRTANISQNYGACIDKTTAREACPICDPVTDVSFSNIKYNSARMSWTGSGNNTTYDIEYGPEGFEQGTGMLFEGTSNLTIDFTDLEEYTHYDVYIKKYCSDSESEWYLHRFSTIRICPDNGESFYFNTQEQLDDFGATYPDCTRIFGHMGVYGPEITDLSPLSNIEQILWGITFRETNLTNLNALGLTKIGGTIDYYTSSGSLEIYNNPFLTDISFIENLNTEHLSNLSIYENPSLSMCNYPVICDYLNNLDGYTIITDNAPGCESIYTIMNACGVECPTGNITFNSQTDIDVFGTVFNNCTEIQGDLIISGEDIDDLSALSSIQSISGSLVVEYNDLLTNLNGLSSLTYIGENLYMYWNNNLQNIDVLSNITDFEGYISISHNESLIDISGISNFNYENIYSLEIFENPMLAVCNVSLVCNYIDNMQGDINIINNAEGCEDVYAVADACGIEAPPCPLNSLHLYTQQDVDDFAINYPNCQTIYGNLYISRNYDDYESDEMITNLEGLSNITSINGSLMIYETLLENLDDLSGLTSINGEIQISYNPELTSISGLSGIDPESIIYTYDGLRITDNPQLSICNIDNLCMYISNNENYRQIYGNAEGCEEYNINNHCGIYCPPGDVELFSQEDINAFGVMYPNCTEISGHLSIYTWNNDITDVSPLSNIQIIQGGFDIGYTNLTNLNAFSNLTTVNGAWVSLYGNEYLEDISGLMNIDLSNLNPIDMEYDGIYLEGNPLLAVCSLPNFCDYLSNDASSHPRYIENNAEGCQDSDAITAACLEPFPCLAPTGIDVIAGINQVTLTWSSLGTSFDIEWGVLDFELGDGLGSQNDVSELNFTITNLTEMTAYDVYIRRNCTDTASQSDWVKFTFSTASTCPSGNVELYSQEDVDNFAIEYSECTSIQGGLYIYGSNIFDLSPLSNITSVAGSLGIGSTEYLENLNGLSSLTHVGGTIYIEYNYSLTDISALQNVNPESFGNLYIVNNPMLEVCNIASFCEYLSDQDNDRSIYNNAPGCEYSYEIENQCFAGNCDSYTIWKGSYWSNGYPEYYTRVIVRGDLSITEYTNACEVYVQSGILSVEAGATLVVEGEIQNEVASNFIIQSGANLLQNPYTVNTNPITVRREAVIKHLDYTIWSSPVANQGLQAFSPYTLPNRIRIYDGDLSANTWVTTTGNFVPGKAYMFRAPNVFDPPYPNAYTWTGNFVGVPQNGDVTATFTNTGKYQSVGNPYPSNIDRQAFHNENQNIGALYFWTNTYGFDDNGNYLGNNWRVVNRLGESTSPLDGSVESQNYIAVGQGFLARTYNDETQVVFNHDMRATDNATFYKSASTENHRYWLNLANQNNVLNQTLVSYNSQSTNALDLGIDSGLANYSGSSLYSLIENNDEKFAIQGRALPFDTTDIVPLGFKAVEAGSYTISLANFDGIFAEGQTIYLKDNFTQVQHNLKLDNYEFVSESGTFNSRFEVIYTTESLGVKNPNLENSWIVYKDTNSFHVLTQGLDMKEVTVYDTLGRVVYSSKADGNSHTIPYVGATQMLIVKVTTVDNQVLTKKVK